MDVRFQIFVMIPTTISDIVGVVEQLMIPYDTERPVLPYRVDISVEELSLVRMQQLPCALFDDTAFCRKLSDWYGYLCFHDEQGYYYLSSDNPKGHWDGWILHDVQTDVYHLPDASICSLDPLAIVTPDGIWHEMPYHWDETTQQKELRSQKAERLLAQYPAHIAVLLDCHC